MLSSSYIVHANMMGTLFVDTTETEHSKMIDCNVSNSNEKSNQQDSSTSCFERCMGEYDQISIPTKIVLESLVDTTTYTNRYRFSSLSVSNTIGLFAHGPPSWSPPVVHHWYIGKTTVLLL